MTDAAKAVRTDNGFGPTGPAPQQNGEPCEGTLEGTIQGTVTGRVTLDNCCCKLVSETQVIDTGPLSTADLAAVLLATAQNYEAQGYIVLAHSLTDGGGTWLIGLTVAWYA